MTLPLRPDPMLWPHGNAWISFVLCTSLTTKWIWFRQRSSKRATTPAHTFCQVEVSVKGNFFYLNSECMKNKLFLKVFQLVTWVLQAVCGCFCWREVTRHSLNLSARLALWDKLTPLRGKSSATYPTQLKTHALASAVCMCKHEQERTRMHRCDFLCWRHSHSPFACPCHLHHHLWPTLFQVLL